jgi:tripartite-type tricarboxylate transporter receptor subunit TctC
VNLRVRHVANIRPIVCRTGLVALCAFPIAALAFPEKPVRIIVPFQAGGAVDIYSRVVGGRAAERLGQPVLIENRAGAGGTIAAELVAKANPDGYTVFAADIGAMAIAPGLYKKLNYDAVRDFAPVQHTIMLPIILIVHPSLPVKSVRDLVALAKKRPGQVDYVSAGSGGIAHLAAEMFRFAAGIDVLHIPTKGGAQQVIELLGGNAQITFTSVSTSLPHVRSGKLRALAAAGPKRSALLPDVPTIAESGFPGFSADGWGGFAVPAKTPSEVITRLNNEFNVALRMPESSERLAGAGFVPVGGTPAEFGAFLRAEIDKWRRVVREAGVKVE